MKNSIWLKLVLLLVFCPLYSQVLGQLDSIHYLPPLKTASATSALDQQLVYFSTPETSAFSVNIYLGTSGTPLTTITGLVNGSPQTYDPGSGQNNITVVDNTNTGTVLTSSGLRFESTGGQKFYVNFRGRSASQAGSLTCKGQAALGTDFRWGGLHNRTNNTGQCNASLGILATVNGTTVTITGYDTGCEFRQGTNAGGITSDTLTISLNAGESYVVEAVREQTTSNEAGYLGARISSTQPITIANGGLNVGVVSGAGSRDVGIDQPVPVPKLGREYVFIRGNGADDTEFPVIIGAQNGTQVYAGGTLVGTINDGEYLEVPGTYYSSSTAGANMYVNTSKEAYAYQCLAGASGNQTISMNFVAPLNCLLPDTIDEVPSIDDIAGLATATSAVTILASTSTPDANINVTDNTGPITLPASSTVAGTSDWKTFYIPGLTGNVEVAATGPVAVGSFMSQGANAGMAAYFSGFDTAPAIEINETGTGCYQGATFTETTGSYSAYQWYMDGSPIPGETTNSYTPDSIGDVSLEITNGTCTYSSVVYPVFYCNPEIVVTKIDNVDPIEEGDTVIFTIAVTNLGRDTVTNFVLSETLPSGLGLVSAVPSKGTWSSPHWSMSSLASGEIQTLTVTAESLSGSGGTIVTNTVSHVQDQTDHNTEPDDLSEQLTIDVALPVELATFYLTIHEKSNVHLYWETLSERNSSHFDLQRTRDLYEWETIETIPAAGQSSELLHYEFVDAIPLDGQSYYRLRQVDQDGKTYFSLIQSCFLAPSEVQVVPNPAKNEIFVSGKWNTPKVRVFMADGTVVTSLVSVLEVTNSGIRLDISRLSSGCYLIGTPTGISRFIRKEN